MNNNILNEATKAIDYKRLQVSSSEFAEGGLIPLKYTCDGKNISPPLDIKGIPEETKSLVIIVDDPDAPFRPWVHWLAWNIPPAKHLKEGRPMETEGLNDMQKNEYCGPCPLSGTHCYFFKVYALDTLLNLPAATSKNQLEKAISEHIIGFGELTGIYKH